MYYFRFIYHKKHVSTVASSVDNSDSMDVVIAKKKREKKRKGSLNRKPERAV